MYSRGRGLKNENRVLGIVYLESLGTTMPAYIPNSEGPCESPALPVRARPTTERPPPGDQQRPL